MSDFAQRLNKQTMKDNKLIAEFMGFPQQSDAVDDRTTAYYIGDVIKATNENNQNEDNVFHPDDMMFDSSWDWLMPVVEKIEMLGYTFEKNYQPIDKDWQCLIVKGLDILYQEFDKSSIKSAHYVVVEFIKRTKKST